MTSLDLSECHLGEEEVGLVWRLCPRLKKLDIGVRRGSRPSLSTGGHNNHFHTVCVWFFIEFEMYVIKISFIKPRAS